ncbi:rRNA maturation RNase YbeY [Qingshengfaniella alkalisoli]|uniref:Endoribonuclease YbeY n=1 Tax=Qingshengfaniella alkalisoli TaxID=2599296 RepID=A0A5B8I5M0_9RHOB|nr:rRNA maturation RNase YbeY [Qingshengfaniella alkalisoli]QDY68659.1 rRNA maturation RNase YbeY [Qingshengfaniella alkalisoli]
MGKLTDVEIEYAAWRDYDLAGLAEMAARAVLGYLNLNTEEFSVSVLGCNDERIRELNAGFREKDKATNVLSWPSAERGADEVGGDPLPPETDFPGEPCELGDIAISLDTCLREAAAGGLPARDHICHLLVHGVLHLLGYDHENDADAHLMESIEIAILAKLGIPDPY